MQKVVKVGGHVLMIQNGLGTPALGKECGHRKHFSTTRVIIFVIIIHRSSFLSILSSVVRLSVLRLNIIPLYQGFVYYLKLVSFSFSLKKSFFDESG